jgi:hypothetical protein
MRLADKFAVWPGYAKRPLVLACLNRAGSMVPFRSGTCTAALRAAHADSAPFAQQALCQIGSSYRFAAPAARPRPKAILRLGPPALACRDQHHSTCCQARSRRCACRGQGRLVPWLRTMHDARCTMHDARCTMHDARCTMHDAGSGASLGWPRSHHSVTRHWLRAGMRAGAMAACRTGVYHLSRRASPIAARCDFPGHGRPPFPQTGRSGSP